MKISACVITKNEEHNLASCLDSVKSIVSEIIVVDTGSNDGTINVAKKYNAKVFNFEWVNDFSKAKNFAISKASGEWIIFLDADERFTTGSSKLVRSCIELAMKQKRNTIACLLSNIDDVGNIINSIVSIRIFRKSIGILYKGEIHEHLYNKSGELIVLNAVDVLQIMHTGYSKQEVERKNKGQRNRDLLFKQLRENPDSSDLCFYISETFLIDREYQKALEFGLKAKSINNWEGMGTAQKNYLNMIQMFMHVVNDPPMHILSELIDEALSDYPKFPDFNIYKADIQLNENRYDDAIECLENAIQNMQMVLTSQSKSYLNLDNTLEKLADCYYKTNQLEMSIKYYVESLKFNKYNLSVIKSLMYILAKYDTTVNIKGFLNKLYDFSNYKDLLYLLKASLLSSNKELSQMFYEYFGSEHQSSLKAEKAYLLLLNNNFSESVAMYHEIYESTSNDEYLEKSFVGSLLLGENQLRLEIDYTSISLRKFGQFLLGFNNDIFESDLLCILNVLLELIKLGNDELLLEMIDKITEINLSYQVAEILYEKEKFDISIKFYDKCLEHEKEIPPESTGNILVRIAECLYKEGKLSLSLKFLQDAQRLNPKNFQIYDLGIRISEKLKDEINMHYFVSWGSSLFPNSNFLMKVKGKTQSNSEIK